MGAHLKRGRCVPANMVGESLPPRHVTAVGLIDLEPDYNRRWLSTLMSSFKRKTGTKAELPVGTRPSPSSPSTLLTSTGIPSLDDILGGGLPLSCSALTLTPDLHSAYGDLVHNYFLAQGLAVGHGIVLIDEEPLRVFDECMWTPVSFVTEQDKKELEADRHEEKVKIAWRYETMKQFQTTVESNQCVASRFWLVGFFSLRHVRD